MSSISNSKEIKIDHTAAGRRKRSVQNYLMSVLVIMLTLLLCVNLFIFLQLNSMIGKINQVFSSNVTIAELSSSLELVEGRVYEYLNTKSSDALEDYYRYEENYRELIGELNDHNVDSQSLMLEKNIRNMSETYLKKTEETIQAKRSRNVERYRICFEEEQKIYGYINSYIYQWNTLQFARNSKNYEILQEAMRQLEIFSIVGMVLIFILCLFISLQQISRIFKPLKALSDAAYQVAEGDFTVELPEPVRYDEVGVVTGAFSQMVISIRAYIDQIRNNMEAAAKMKERELTMEAHLHEAQLRYLQAQINPHFLFNSLNAGAQLATMEDAEQTEVFLGRMADFFRYNVKKTEGDASLREEIDAVDNYIYILNVRYAGEITYTKEIGEALPEIRMPSMILQPIVENAVSHGIHDNMEEGCISLQVDRDEEGIRITVTDNGVGMTRERISEVMEGKHRSENEDGNSTGIGLDNVISRLKLYYNRENLVQIESEGIGMGTTVRILLPIREEQEMETEDGISNSDR